MKSKLIGLFIVLIGSLSFAWHEIPPSSAWVAITRVTTSETRSLDFLPDNDGGWDYGDTTNAIIERFGGRVFEFGTNIQVEVYVSNPPESNSWGKITLAYMMGTNSGTSEDWIMISSNLIIDSHVVMKRGCHLGLKWIPPIATNYLIRIWGITTNGLETANLNAINIDAKGDGLTWDNHEVVLIKIDKHPCPSIK